MPNLSSQFVTCPKCNGAGKQNNLICNECGGIGLGTFIKNDFLYWGYDLTPAKIIVRQSQLIFDYVLDIIFLILGAGGIISLIWWLAQNAVAENNKIYLGALISFWGEKNSLILYFWIGLAFLFFGFYRWQRRKEKHLPVKIFTYRERQKFLNQPQIIPNNWRELRFFKTKIDASHCYREELLRLIEKASAMAAHLKQPEILPVHVLLTAIGEYSGKRKDIELKRISAVFARLGIYRGKIGPKLEQVLQKIPAVAVGAGAPSISVELKRSLIEAYVQAQNNKHYYIELSDLLSPLIQESVALQEIFKELNISPEKIANAVQWLLMSDRYAVHFSRAHKNKRANWQWRLERATAAVATPILNHFCVDLTQSAISSPEAIFVNREEAVSAIFKFFSGKNTKVALVGPKGSGKEALLNHLALLMATDEVPKILVNRRLLRLDLEKLQAAANEFDWKQKLYVVLHELSKANAVLAMPNISDELWEMINKYPANIFVIVTAEHACEGAQPVALAEPTANTLLQILASNAVALEQKYKVNFNYEALLVAAQAAKNYASDEVLPGKAAKLLKHIAKSYANAPDRNITADAAAKIIAGEVGVPYTKILKEIN